MLKNRPLRLERDIIFFINRMRPIIMSTNSKKQTTVSALWGISAVICAVTAIISGMSGDYGLAAASLSMMSLAFIVMGVFMKRDASRCSESNTEMTLE
jgi:hypothetical protein